MCYRETNVFQQIFVGHVHEVVVVFSLYFFFVSVILKGSFQSPLW